MKRDDPSAMRDLARRCEVEAENWRGQPMYDGLLKIARELRSRAQHLAEHKGEG